MGAGKLGVVEKRCADAGLYAFQWFPLPEDCDDWTALDFPSSSSGGGMCVCLL